MSLNLSLSSSFARRNSQMEWKYLVISERSVFCFFVVVSGYGGGSEWGVSVTDRSSVGVLYMSKTFQS